MPKRLARDKRNNLLRKVVIYDRKKFYNIVTWCVYGAMTLSTMKLSLMPLSIMTITITTLSITTKCTSKLTISITTSALCLVLFMPSIKLFVTLSVIMPSVVMLSVIMLRVIMLYAITLSVVAECL
jgi:hypothetical protein